MEQVKITPSAAAEIFLARQLIEYARDVLLAQQLIGERERAPDLLPVVGHLLAVANCKHLGEAEKALRGETSLI